MEARAWGGPLSATLQINLAGLPPPPDGSIDAWDYLMEKLLCHPAITDPVVSNDLDAGSVWISFDFEATGNVQEDVTKAMGFLAEATRLGHPSTFDWEQWLGGPTSPGTVQYPVPVFA